jgi:hypothetical protein
MRTLLSALVLLGLCAAFSSAHAQSSRHVVVNQERLSDADVAALEQRYGVRIQDGAYWYDDRIGTWGFDGGPAVGVIPAGLGIGGPLRADASGGTTGVFVNGRELHRQDLAALAELLGPIEPGRYWADASGNVGREGGPALVNVYAVARARGANTFYRSGNTDYGSGSSGGTFYIMGEDWSVTVD